LADFLHFLLTKSVRVTLLTCKIAHTVSGLDETWAVPVWKKVGKDTACPCSLWSPLFAKCQRDCF